MEGRLKVSGRAPDGLTWEGPFGVIEKPLPLSMPEQAGRDEENAHGKEMLEQRIQERCDVGQRSHVPLRKTAIR